jgi:hypothetical protein
MRTKGMTMKASHFGQIAAPSVPETIGVGEDGTNEHECLACPFCGCTDIRPQKLQVMPRCRHDFAVICHHCDAVGPWAFTPELAVKIWNEGFTLRRSESYRVTRKIGRSRDESNLDGREIEQEPQPKPFVNTSCVGVEE